MKKRLRKDRQLAEEEEDTNIKLKLKARLNCLSLMMGSKEGAISKFDIQKVKVMHFFFLKIVKITKLFHLYNS